jgi:hypothetical protein
VFVVEKIGMEFNCQTVKPPTKEGQPDVQRCEHCWGPKRLAVIGCVHPKIAEKEGVVFKPIFGFRDGGIYLFVDVIPAPDWCPLKVNEVDK